MVKEDNIWAKTWWMWWSPWLDFLVLKNKNKKKKKERERGERERLLSSESDWESYGVYKSFNPGTGMNIL